MAIPVQALHLQPQEFSPWTHSPTTWDEFVRNKPESHAEQAGVIVTVKIHGDSYNNWKPLDMASCYHRAMEAHRRRTQMPIGTARTGGFWTEHSAVNPNRADAIMQWSPPRNVPSNQSTIDRPEQHYVEYYRRINWERGEFASDAARADIKAFWINSGQAGAEWLLRRFLQETDFAVQEGVANLLADIGPGSIRPIIRVLRRQLRSDRVEFLLKALGWIGPIGSQGIVDEKDLIGLIEFYLKNADQDVRVAACSATGILSREQAIGILRRQLERESDSSIIEVIEDFIADRE